MADDSEAPSSSSSDFQSSISKEGHEVFKRTRKRVPLIQRSLAVVLASLQGVQVVIELKNDNEITGTVDETDSNMNVTLQNVRQVSTYTLSRCNDISCNFFTSFCFVSSEGPVGCPLTDIPVSLF